MLLYKSIRTHYKEIPKMENYWIHLPSWALHIQHIMPFPPLLPHYFARTYTHLKTKVKKHPPPSKNLYLQLGYKVPLVLHPWCLLALSTFLSPLVILASMYPSLFHVPPSWAPLLSKDGSCSLHLLLFHAFLIFISQYSSKDMS